MEETGKKRFGVGGGSEKRGWEGSKQRIAFVVIASTFFQPSSHTRCCCFFLISCQCRCSSLDKRFTSSLPARMDSGFLSLYPTPFLPIQMPRHRRKCLTTLLALEWSGSQSAILTKILLELNVVSVSDWHRAWNTAETQMRRKWKSISI